MPSDPQQNDTAEEQTSAETETSQMTEETAPEASIEEQLEAALKKAQENWELVLRTQAELENLRKRTQRDIESAHKYALERLASELLAIRDSMELGLSASQESKDVKSLREGVKLTLKMLIQLMEKFEIREIYPEQEKFNPELHQAMAMQESDQLAPNTVISVMQKGYVLKDRLLRPALVIVAKAPATPATDQ
jgi:molecular chaperone GrpE